VLDFEHPVIIPTAAIATAAATAAIAANTHARAAIRREPSRKSCIVCNSSRRQ
jgi:hypothetical protein